MIFSGFDWSWADALVGGAKNGASPDGRHYANVWTYRSHGRDGRITCGHLHPNPNTAENCGELINQAYVKAKRGEKVGDSWHVARILARHNRVSYRGVVEEAL